MRKVIRTWATVAGVCIVAAVVVVGSVALVDEYYRGEVKSRVAAGYFSGVRAKTLSTVEEKLREGGCDVRGGLAAATDFLNGERRHMVLGITRHAKWGWQVQRYRFVIRWRSNSWVAKFKLNEAHRPDVLDVNEEFEDEVDDAVCNRACGWLKCLFA